MQNNKKSSNLKIVFMFVLTLVALFGCVTEQKEGDVKVLDKSKTLDLHVQMALGYIERGNRESARHHLTKAFEINKNSVPATEAMAMLYQLEGEPVLAEEQFKLAIKRDKTFTKAHNSYGIFLFNQKRYEEAYVEFEKAASDLGYGDRAKVLTYVGRAALKLGNVTRAQAAFEHASVLDRSNSDALIELADINFQKKEFAAAKNYLDSYESVAGNSARSILIALRLEKIFGNKDKEASLAILLKNKFPYSAEYLEYKNHVVN